MEPVSEDTIKEVGWREMPLFNGRQWLIAIGAYSFLFVSVVLLTTPIIVTTKTTALEQELVEKKKDLELRASFTAETENQTWLISTLVKVKGTMTPEQRKLLQDTGIECKFHVNPDGTTGAVSLISPSSDKQMNALVLKLIKSAQPFPSSTSEVAKRSTLLLSFKKAPEISFYR
ncbi:TonB C-terminal domain-containing protein [bacterium]|nr:TonB C-terminal domain-containing protein [bacterium]